MGGPSIIEEANHLVEITLKGRHTAVPQQVRDYAERRIGRLDHYLPTLGEATVEINEEETKAAGDRFVVQVTAVAHGRFLRAEERSGDPRAAIDAAHDAMVRQLQRLKAKVYKSNQAAKVRDEASEPPAVEEEPATDASLLDGKVVRVKRFSLKPMTEEEAAEQMELLGHTFFLFIQPDTRHPALLYKRRDGQYGLIIPED